MRRISLNIFFIASIKKMCKYSRSNFFYLQDEKTKVQINDLRTELAAAQVLVYYAYRSTYYQIKEHFSICFLDHFVRPSTRRSENLRLFVSTSEIRGFLTTRNISSHLDLYIKNSVKTKKVHKKNFFLNFHFFLD